jgi:NDP-sugar pyrophosphorylase family protein
LGEVLSIGVEKSTMNLQAAIIAAGEGTRIVSQRCRYKSLVPVGKFTLLGFQLKTLEAAGFSRVAVVVRKDHGAVIDYLNSFASQMSIEYVARNTKGGMYSLREVCQLLVPNSPFFLLSVDAVYSPAVFKNFVEVCLQSAKSDIVTWVVKNTSDDSCPVGVILENDQVQAFGKSLGETEYIAEGPYFCQPSIVEKHRFADAIKLGITRLSEYLGLLLSKGTSMRGYLVEEVFDVDTQEDVARAESFLRKTDLTLLS